MKIKPKYVYVVVNTERFQINGCFYNKLAAEKWAGDSPNMVVQKLPVI